MSLVSPGPAVLPTPAKPADPATAAGPLGWWLDVGWAIGLAAILLVWPAIWNGYPLVFADSGTYLGQALLGYVGWDRPPFYSLFLYALHWRLSLWPVVAGQGLLLAHLLHLVLRTQGHPGPAPLLLTALALAMLSGLPFFAAQIQPDVFTGVVVLCAWLIGFRQAALSRPERCYVLLLATLATVVHQSHLPLAFGLAGIGTALWARRGVAAALRALARLALPPVVALLALIGVNWAAHGIAAPSPYGSVFFATRMLFDESGQAWLARHCAATADRATPFKVCALQGGLGEGHNDFLWTLDGPLYATLGGPKGWAAEAGVIVRSMVLEDPATMLRAALANTLEQLGRAATGDGLSAWPGTPGPEPLIARFFPAEHAAFLAAGQQRGVLLPLALRLSPLHGAVFLACLVGLLAAAAVARPAAAAARVGGADGHGARRGAGQCHHHRHALRPGGPLPGAADLAGGGGAGGRAAAAAAPGGGRAAGGDAPGFWPGRRLGLPAGGGCRAGATPYGMTTPRHPPVVLPRVAR